MKYYDNGNYKQRKLAFTVNSCKKIKVLKIVVTMDEYLDLAESPYNFIDDNYIDTWFVNLMTLKKYYGNRIQKNLLDMSHIGARDIKQYLR